MILLIDNYDSFTYNVCQGIGELYENIEVVRNDEITVEELAQREIEALIISPGPGYPESAGISKEAVRYFAGKVPVLGICLGHQAIGEVFGAKTVRAKTLMHGKQSKIQIDSSLPLFQGLPEIIPAARYHSLILEGESIPEVLTVAAEDDEGQIMAVKHRDYDVYGIQFHPESILTESGKAIFENFLKIAGIETKTEKKVEEMEPAQKTAMKPYLEKIVEGRHLTADEAYGAMDCIMSGGATQAQIASFVTGLRMNHETVDEITGFAKVMRAKAAVVPNETEAIDIVGTGGDLASSFNISTTSAFVIAGAGQKVAKHGNRSVSSKSGAADVLEALGAKKVGVFVNEPLRSLISISEEAGLDIIQLHGDEGEEYIKEVKHETGKELWKAVRVRMVKDIQEAQRLPADKLLLDSFSEESYGGTGKVMDFAVLDQADIRKPYFIAGGLTVENLPEILKKAEPYGIDISSGIETEGVKDREKMLKVIQCVRGGKDE